MVTRVLLYTTLILTGVFVTMVYDMDATTYGASETDGTMQYSVSSLTPLGTRIHTYRQTDNVM